MIPTLWFLLCVVKNERKIQLSKVNNASGSLEVEVVHKISLTRNQRVFDIFLLPHPTTLDFSASLQPLSR